MCEGGEREGDAAARAHAQTPLRDNTLTVVWAGLVARGSGRGAVCLAHVEDHRRLRDDFAHGRRRRWARPARRRGVARRAEEGGGLQECGVHLFLRPGPREALGSHAHAALGDGGKDADGLKRGLDLGRHVGGRGGGGSAAGCFLFFGGRYVGGWPKKEGASPGGGVA